MFKKLNPRRLWLLHFQGERIESQASNHIPYPYIGSELLANIRFIDKLEAKTPHLGKGEVNSAADQGHADSMNRLASVSKSQRGSGLGIAGAEAATFYGFGLYEKFQQVDDHVYEAMSRLAGENIATIADLNASLGEYKHDIFGEISNGVLSKWKGHLAEVYAAEHFSANGHEIIWPDDSNQEGYDLFLDGHAVNVKLVSDASSLYGHFNRFPEIPVVVPSDVDLGGVADDAFQLEVGTGIDQQLEIFLNSNMSHKVIIDREMSIADITDQANDAADVAVGGANVAEAHFPWITAATATWREGRLLYEHNTDLKSAGKNLTADIVGKGGGAAAGAKAGDALGTIISPVVGTAIGVIVGGVFGAIAGGIASNTYKRKDLEVAIERVIESQKKLKQLQSKLEKSSKQKVDAKKCELQTELNALNKIHKDSIDSESKSLRDWREKALRIEKDEMADLIQSIQIELAQLCEPIEKKLIALSFWRRWVWPDADSLGLDVALDRIHNSLDRINSATNAWLINGAAVSEIVEFLSREGVAIAGIKRLLRSREVERIKRQTLLRQKIDLAYGHIAFIRHQSFQAICKLIRSLSDEIRNGLRPELDSLQEKIEIVNSEKRKLGIA